MNQRPILLVIRAYAASVMASIAFAAMAFAACFLVQTGDQAHLAAAVGYAATWITAIVFLAGLVIYVCCGPDREASSRTIQWMVIAFCALLATAFFMPPIVT